MILIVMILSSLTKQYLYLNSTTHNFGILTQADLLITEIFVRKNE